MKNLYNIQKLSTGQIAKKFGCNHVTILNRMKKHGIKSRGYLGLTKPIAITKDKLKYLYNARGLSASKIARIIHRSTGGIERKIKQFEIETRNIDNRACKYKKYDFSGNLIEKAYMIGFRLGDLNVYPTKNLIIARCSTTKKNQVKLIKNLFSPYTNPHTAIAKRGTFEITAHLNKSFSFLLPKQDNIESWILENPQHFWAFFAGYSDAEGSLYFKKTKRKQIKLTPTYELESYDKNIIQELWKGFKQDGIQPKTPYLCRLKGYPCGHTKYFSSNDMWRLTVNRKIDLWKLIYFWKKYSRHKDKQLAIGKAISNIILRNKLPHCHKIDLSIPKSDGVSFARFLKKVQTT